VTLASVMLDPPCAAPASASRRWGREDGIVFGLVGDAPPLSAP
jgi:hypothetical protein